MNTLDGKEIMVWTFMGNARMYQALRDYGDRISQIGLFSFKVKATGEIYESGVAISNMLTYINKWKHIKWLLTVSNDGTNSIFKAIRDNTSGAQDKFLSELVRIMQKYLGVMVLISTWKREMTIPLMQHLRLCLRISTTQ